MNHFAKIAGRDCNIFIKGKKCFQADIIISLVIGRVYYKFKRFKEDTV